MKEDYQTLLQMWREEKKKRNIDDRKENKAESEKREERRENREVEREKRE